jgi:hypothetical protein
MPANEQQVEAWNGGESVHYVDHADRYDRSRVSRMAGIAPFRRPHDGPAVPRWTAPPLVRHLLEDLRRV